MSLTKDIYFVILQNFKATELTALRVVCHLFKTVIDEITKNHAYDLYTYKSQNFLEKLKGLNTLGKFSKLYFKDNISDFNFWDDFCIMWNHNHPFLKNIKGLSLFNIISNKYVVSFEKFKILESLTIISTGLDNFVNVKDLPITLKKIYCDKPFDFNILKNLENLEDVHLKSDSKIKENTSFLINKKIKNFYLSNFTVNKGDITSLKIEKCHLINCQIYDGDFLKNNAGNLIKFSDIGSKYTDGYEDGFNNLVKLERFVVPPYFVKNFGFLENLKNLRILSVNNNRNFGDDDLKIVCINCKKLEELNISRTNVNDIKPILSLHLNILTISQKLCHTTDKFTLESVPKLNITKF